MEQKVKEALEKARWKSGNELLEQWIETMGGRKKDVEI